MRAPTDAGDAGGWGQRWVELVAPSTPSRARSLQRGQAIARRGGVDDLRVVPGRVSATVRDDRLASCRVELRWPTPDEDAWRGAVEALSDELRFTAALLDGDLPEDLGERLAHTGVALVPEPDEVEIRCSCDDVETLCRHAVALVSAFGVLVDRDPYLLLLLRGRDRDRLLREVRSPEPSAAATTAEGIDPGRGLEAVAGDLEAVRLHPEPVEDAAALFLHLGDPPAVDDPSEFAAIIERTATAAWRLAAGEGPAVAEEELLLSELRAQRVASVSSLADALGRDIGEVQEELDRLFSEGAVLRTGTGDRARYRAATS